jgi:DNA-directed RNA polymerase subunit F
MAIAGLLGLSAAAAQAQSTDPMAPQPSKAAGPKRAENPAGPKGADDDALAGPRVDKPSAAKTIVERNFDGALVRLDQRPEEAAAALLTLSPEEKKAVSDLFGQRSKKVSQLLYDHYDTFLQLQAARQSGVMRQGKVDPKEREELAEKMREIGRAAAQAGLIRPPLVEQVAAVLPDDQAGELRRMVSEYMVALDQQNRREMGIDMQGAFSRPGAPTPDQAERRGADQRMELNLLLREVARTFGAEVQERKERLDALVKAVDATPEQEAKITKILRETGEKNRGKKLSPEDRADVFRQILDVLTPEQRQLARERLRPGADR